MTAVSQPERGWLTAQGRITGLSTNSAHRVVAGATHNSLITGIDTAASSQAILDVLASIRTGTALR